MADTYADIVKQIEELKIKAEAMRKAEVADVIAKIREAIAVYGLNADDLFSNSSRKRAKRGSAKAKKASAVSNGKRASSSKSSGKPSEKHYADGNGNTWSGRGPRPHWLRDALAAGHDLTEFLV